MNFEDYSCIFPQYRLTQPHWRVANNV